MQLDAFNVVVLDEPQRELHTVPDRQLVGRVPVRNGMAIRPAPICLGPRR
jgi:hypothetical protein